MSVVPSTPGERRGRVQVKHIPEIRKGRLMRRIYHMVSPSVWHAGSGEPYAADSLKSEGFIHCSNGDQVARVANLFYAEAGELLVLCINANVLGGLVRDEDGGTGERFPHVYGPIDRSAIIGVMQMQRGPDGRWMFSEGDFVY
jgi:uncharacterized protein (DUF952 family)